MVQRSKTIVFSGGHHNSALLVAKALKSKGYHIVWLGHRHTSTTDANISQEYRDVVSADIAFVDLKSGKMYRGNVLQFVKTVVAIFVCLGLFLKERPSLVVSFGGYLGVPPVLAAWLLRIPSISHEQTTVLGMANKAMLPMVRKMFLTWPIDSYLSHKNVEVIGLPASAVQIGIQSKGELNTYLSKNKTPMIFANPEKPLLVVSGGKQGSHAVNELVEHSLRDLLPNWNIFHQCGSNLATKDYQRLIRKRQRLPYEMQTSYVIVDYFPRFRDVLALADMIVGRSGAHTTMEVLQLAKKMVAIPLPFSYEDEQKKNAQKLVDAGLGFILPQTMASPSKLIEIVSLMSKREIDMIKVESVRKQTPSQALEKMIGEIEEMLS